MSRPLPETRDKFAHFCEITTRWKDNDVYGHVNNVVYYSYFDTCVTGYSIAQGVLDPQHSPNWVTVAFVMNSAFLKMTKTQRVLKVILYTFMLIVTPIVRYRCRQRWFRHSAN